ncbi:MAG: response regulator transcription factor [Gammaproteobacteria bacterium]|nr:response regulator transcription factor [Gammaproteobacteria bacterium]
MTRPRILLADDHRIVAEGLGAILAGEFDLVGVVEDGQALIDAARALRPDVVVADIGMPRRNGFDALAEMRKEDPGVRVVFLTMHPEPAYARRALEAGALGYVVKHSATEELVTAIRSALAGQTYVAPALAAELARPAGQAAGRARPAGSMTPRQREILQLLADGYAVKEIARRLDISPRTVEFHKRQMMESVGVHSTAQLINWAVKEGLVVI